MSRTEVHDLTPDQLAELPRYRARWEALRTSTAPADRADAEAGVVEAQIAAGLPAPDRIVWCDSPIMIAHQRRVPDAAHRAGGNVKVIVFDLMVRAAGRAVDAALSRSTRNRVWSEARPGVPPAAGRAIVEAVAAGADRGPAGLLPSLLHVWRSWRRHSETAWAELSFAATGISQNDVAQLGPYDFLREVCGLERQTEPLAGLLRVARSAGWMVPHESTCWLSERHSRLTTDPEGRLHCADGPALAYRDGWRHFAWKGVPVPAWMIERPETITASVIDRQRDPVLRRCMIDIMTPARYIAGSDARRVAEDETGILWLKTWHHWDRWAAVEVINGTPEPDGSHKHYFLQVPPTVRSAREAVAWTYGLSEFEYASLKQRT